jgi:hypothetical protein
MVTHAYHIDAAHCAEIQARALAMEDQGVRACLNGDHCRARQALCDALVLFEFIGDRRGMADVIDRMGVVRLSEGQADMATSYFHRAYMMLSDLGERRKAADVLRRLGEAYVGIDRPHLALKTLIEAHAMFVAADAGEPARELAEMISKLHVIVQSRGL